MDADGLTEALARVRSVTRTDMPLDMRAVFADDPGRAGRFTAALDDLTIDCSKCAITDSILEALIDLARACRLESRRDAMFAGERINVTENRAALHVALRAPRSFVDPPYGSEIARTVHEVLDRATDFASRVRNGVAKGATGKRFVDIVNIGIGGSDLGPAMATAALAPYHDGPRAHFVSNVDGAEIMSTLDRLDPESSLFIVASKTFTTTETMMNAGTARRWLREKLGDGAVRHHFAAVSTAHDRVREFGIDPQRVFGFWDWVGGRYSLWSAIGLPLMIAVGPANFRSFLDGGHALDRHFADAPLRSNLPVLLGLIGYWHRAILGYPSRAVVPYDRRLARFPAYLQQLDMESNGKGVGLDGSGLAGPSGPVVWGEPGTNGQHAFFQLLHQGTDIVPVEFLAAASGHEPGLDHHHRLLLANCLAQSEALMLGRGTREAEQRLIAAGHSPKDAARLAPHRRFPGNRPSITILYRKLDPFGLGRLIALYEHRVFVEAVLYGINPFDQWGVELGKELATALVPLIDGGASVEDHDASTASLVARIRALRTGR